MDERIARLEASVEQLRAVVDGLSGRLAALEARPAVAAAGECGAPTVATVEAARPPSLAARLAGGDVYDPIVILSLIGRLLFVLAGGFFLRAMTEAGVLAPAAGIGCAFAYGLLWLLLADRAARHGQRTSAMFHALAAALVVFPLLLEATTRFHVLGGGASALVLALLSAGFLAIAWRQRLSAVAWLAVAAAVPTSLVLLVDTGAVAPFAGYLVALGLATLWLAEARSWPLLCWPAALAADVVVAGLTLRALAPEQPAAPRVALLLQWMLLTAYLAALALRTLRWGRVVTVFDAVQTAAVLLVGFGGTAFLLLRLTGQLPVALGVAGVAGGAGCYAVARGLLHRRPALERNAVFHASLALVLVLAGSVLALPRPLLSAVLAALGAGATLLWSRYGRRILLLHGAAYGVAAAVASGALLYGAPALLLDPDGPWTLPGAASFGVLLAAAASAWFAARRPSPQGGGLAGALRLVLIVVLLWMGSSLVIGLVAPLVAGRADASVDPGALATLRTGVLAIVTLLVAAIARRPGGREWRWLVYPLLVGIGLKMVLQDFEHSRPATLFIALALYGAALIIAPRLRQSAIDPRKSLTVAAPVGH